MCLSLFFCGFDLMELSARLAQNARLAASVVTFGASLMWSVVEYFSCMKLLAGSVAVGASGPIWSHLQPSGVILSHLELSGPIWSHLESSIWSHLELSGGIWTCLEPSGAIWNHRAFWSHLKLSGLIWWFSGGMSPYDLSFSLIWFHLIRLNSIWCFRFDVIWCVLISFVSIQC